MATPIRWGMKLPDGTPLRYGMKGLRYGGTLEEVIAAMAQQNNTMNPILINAVITDEDKTTALASFQSVQTLFPFMRPLTADEKKTINDAANGRLPFSQQANQYAQQYPEVFPSKFSLPDLAKIVAFLTQFLPIVDADDHNHAIIQDTFRIANSNAYDMALKVYEYFKAANTNGDYNDVVAHLGTYFEGQGRKKAAPAAKLNP